MTTLALFFVIAHCLLLGVVWRLFQIIELIREERDGWLDMYLESFMGEDEEME